MKKEVTVIYKGTKKGDNLICTIREFALEEAKEITNFIQNLSGVKTLIHWKSETHSPAPGQEVRTKISEFGNSNGLKIKFTWYESTGTLNFQGQAEDLFSETLDYVKENYNITYE
ncbi:MULTISPECIES: hypothetical protein [Streptococcus]|uniref:Uncharacterized protein n=2 Tax=Streptococcus suis TaxID=1307 RepID=A0A3Q8B816_STRSU|nr:hypothetical protein [Streptococcus suis]ASW49757.1 hypothetical protein A7J08_05520 [Streptococcus suis]KPA71844.1 hypothetical protein WQ51_06535 [Streptococcus suis]MBM7319753.1 hypothetical protein [Streptococcus suis]MCK3923827.1 hypothetical protein [Streptococcus suis]MCK4069814.1 hypothetical protein [Streptococcus suis]